MKILQLCKKFPHPLKDGESIAVTNLASALHHHGVTLDLLAMNTTKHQVDVEGSIPMLSHYRKIQHIHIDNEVKAISAFLNLFSQDSYNITRFDSKKFGKRLKKMLRDSDYDFVQLESLYLAPYIDLIRANSKARIVLRAHNVEHEIWERMAINEELVVRRWYIDYLARKLKKYELEQLDRVDLLVVISNADRDKFRALGYNGPLVSVPIGIELETAAFEKVQKFDPPSLSFIGSLDWMPNVEGLNWFLSQIWPSLITIYPDLTLHVAGRNMPDWMYYRQHRSVIFWGEVEDAQEFLLQHPLTIVPIRSGSGMRAKIIESMALGRVVLTTRIGGEGIDLTHGKNSFITDDLNDFVQVLKTCRNNPATCAKISVEARKFVEKYYDHQAVVANLFNYLRVLANPTKST